MMHWLLKREGYPPAIAISVVLHVALLLFIFVLSRDSKHELRIIQPAAIQATTIQDNPQRQRKAERIELQRKQEEQRKQAEEQKRKADEEKAQQELLVKQEAEKKLQQQKQQQLQDQQKRKLEDDQKKQTAAREAEQQKNKEKLKKEEDDRLKAERELEARRLQAQQQALTEEQQLVAQYIAYIKDLVREEWSRPPSAKNGMQAVVQLTVVPTGEIVTAQVVQGSGDVMFDNSVLQAVKKVQRFPDLQKLSVQNAAVFDRNFRNFNLLFQPEDLLR
ncbi:MAG TPA: TonB family protein [Candidatus Acidoferrum sp.]|nr:TonB family protein [Candidatus Acidoferrum sp.]